MSNGTVLVIDQGSHASRALVFDRSYKLLSRAIQPITTLRPGPGRAEHQAQELLDSVRLVIDQAVQEAGVRPDRAGLATQRSTVVCWDRDTGQALAPALSWQDTRAGLPGDLDENRVRETTGLRLSRHYGAAKLKWCLEHLPAIATAYQDDRLAAGPLASFLIQDLCRERPFLIDPCNASRTLLFDSGNRHWDDWLLAKFGLDVRILPTPAPNHHPFGTLETPLGPVPLEHLTGDQSTVPYAFGPLTDDRVWIQVGTGAFLQRLAEKPVPDLLHSVIRDDSRGQIRVIEGTVNGAGAAVEQVADDLDVEWRINTTAVSELMGSAVLPLFINGIGGLGSPDWIADFSSRFHGDGSPHQKLAAVLESVVFLVQRNLERMGPGIADLVVSGGLTGMDRFCQMLADVSGIEVVRNPQPEATALGLAVLLNDAPASSGSDGETFQPSTRPTIRKRYERWTREMP